MSRSWLFGWLLKISTIYLGAYLFTYLYYSSIPSPLYGWAPACSLLVRAPASNWFSNPNAAEANGWCCSAPEEKPIHNPTACGLSFAANGQPARAPGVEKLEEEEAGGFCTWWQKKWLSRDCTQLWEVTGAPLNPTRHVCKGWVGWTEVELKPNKWLSLGPTPSANLALGEDLLWRFHFSYLWWNTRSAPQKKK